MLTHFQGAIGSIGFYEPITAGGGCRYWGGRGIGVGAAANWFDIGNLVAATESSPGGQRQTQGKQQPPGVDGVGCRGFGYRLRRGLGNNGSFSRFSKGGLAIGDWAG